VFHKVPPYKTILWRSLLQGSIVQSYVLPSSIIYLFFLQSLVSTRWDLQNSFLGVRLFCGLHASGRRQNQLGLLLLHVWLQNTMFMWIYDFRIHWKTRLFWPFCVSATCIIGN
jgi:hypothetical protein